MKDELNGLIIKEAYFLGIKKYGYQYYDRNNQLITKSLFAGVVRKVYDRLPNFSLRLWNKNP